jgi:hypothetical protein
MLLIRGSLFLLAGLLLAGCMQTGTLAPSSDANFTARDKQQLANPPYQRVAISPTYQRQIVQFHRKEAPGSVVVETSGPHRFIEKHPEVQDHRKQVIEEVCDEARSNIIRAVMARNLYASFKWLKCHDPDWA